MIKETNRRFGLVLKDHFFELPLDYTKPDSEKITVFAREVVDQDKDSEKLPWLVYFQGGPGFPSPRLTGNSSWHKKALKKYRLLLLDQRGTGLSSPINTQTLAKFGTGEDQADYLGHFRVDNIVNDAEAIRKALLGEDEKWSVMGQSYGGFCIVHYLSAAPEALKEGFITGGVPSLSRHIDDVYRETHKFCKAKSAFYYECYPNDVEKVKEIASFIRDTDVRLPCGDRLSVRRFQMLGMHLGFARGPEAIHHAIEGAFVEGVDGKTLGYGFLRTMENFLSFDTNPIFAILHESIYAQQFASRWSAERMRKLYPEFDEWEDRFLFTGELIGPWIFEEFTALQPLKEAAHILADKENWPPLYDIEKLKQNKVPVACAVYFNDMFVNQQYSLETIHAIPNMKAWVTSEYEHCGVGVDGERVFERLSAMVSGKIDR